MVTPHRKADLYFNVIAFHLVVSIDFVGWSTPQVADLGVRNENNFIPGHFLGVGHVYMFSHSQLTEAIRICPFFERTVRGLKIPGPFTF